MKIDSRLRLGAVLPITYLLLTQVVWGQTAASLTGEARDKSGAAVPNVSITAVNEATGAARTAATNSSGVYSFPSLAPGMYTLRAEASGFKAIVLRQVEL